MKKRYNFTLDDETAEKLKELAEKSHTNMSQWITAKVWESAKAEIEDKSTERMRAEV